jgi:hypothetical protein
LILLVSLILLQCFGSAVQVSFDMSPNKQPRL